MSNYAIVKFKSKQYRVTVGDVIDVDKINTDVGDFVKIEDVMFLFDDGEAKIGTPVLPDSYVSGKVLDHYKTAKKISGKYKNKTRNRKRFGHRKSLTSLQIVEISDLKPKAKAATAKPKAKAATAKPKAKAATAKPKAKKTDN